MKTNVYSRALRAFTIHTALAVLATTNLFAQGTINFANNVGSQVYIDRFDPANLAPGGTTYMVGLYTAPLGTTADNGFIMVGGAAGFGGAPTTRTGIFGGGVRTVTAATPGGSILVQVRGWETAFGNNYESVAAGGQGRIGKSNTFTVDTGDPTTTPAGNPALLTGLEPFVIGRVPEPSVIAIGILGVGALLLRRRRK